MQLRIDNSNLSKGFQEVVSILHSSNLSEDIWQDTHINFDNFSSIIDYISKYLKEYILIL